MRIADALESGEKDFSSVDGLTWLGDDGTPVTNKDRRLLTDRIRWRIQHGTCFHTINMDCCPLLTLQSQC